MNVDLSVFQEPRGVMRIFQFIFSICAFSTTSSFTNSIKYNCTNVTVPAYTYEYPFVLHFAPFADPVCNLTGRPKQNIEILADFSSDAQFFVATGVLSLLYCIAILAVYTMFDSIYKNDTRVPLGDFIITVILAVFWISGSGAWANGVSCLKDVTSSKYVPYCCTLTTGTFSSLNISIILGFLNFFLWASDLWFIYKETVWFQQRQPTSDGMSPGI